MDDGSFSIRAKGLQERTRDGSGRSEICVAAFDRASQQRLRDHLADTWGLEADLSLEGKRQVPFLVFAEDETAKLHALIAPFIHPSMQYKLLARYQDRFGVEPAFAVPRQVLMPMPITRITVKPPTRSMHRYDLEVGGTHNYFADGVMVHNSPETTPGGRALKFYSSVRLDIRRIESLKDGAEVVGNRTRVKVVKNKVAPPFRQAEFEILYGEGTSREGEIIELGVRENLIDKAGAWYSYKGDRIGQGKENVRQFLRDNPAIANEVDAELRSRLLVKAGPKAEASTEADELEEV
jgi:recombination protein RecA